MTLVMYQPTWAIMGIYKDRCLYVDDGCALALASLEWCIDELGWEVVGEL